ncbi:hypothetical protein CHUAL_006670 [Chamberlinius hualienensis]
MAGTTLSVKLTRSSNQSWGFRLQGGKDFNSPLSVAKVTNGSLAEKAGLQSGDAILKINDLATENLRHKEAQDAIVRAGNHFEVLVQRGGSKIWKPSVTQISTEIHSVSNEIKPVTKTSLAATTQEVRQVGSGYNVKPKPFGQQNGDQRVPALVHKQYNSPAPLYSMQNIADTLTAQAEVLSTGAVGFNFMKNNPQVNKDSAVYRMVLEEATVPPEKQEEIIEDAYAKSTTQEVQSRSFKALQKTLDDGEEPPAQAHLSSLRHVEPPKPVAPKEPSSDAKSNENLCGECGRLIVGVFVRIKDRNLHADCFKCTTCGASLRNVGYYNINEKLYCDIHARQVAKNSAPSVVTIPGTGSTSAKEVHIVGVASQAAPSSGSFSPSAGSFSPSAGTFSPSAGTFSPSTNYSSFQSVKPSLTTPISVDTSTVRHIQSSTTDVHRQMTGGSKFTWPPSKHSDSSAAEPIAIDTSLSPTIPTYRAPPSTQHVQFTSAKFKQSSTSQSSSATYGPAVVASPKSSPSFSPLIPSKPSVPSTPAAAAPSSPTPSSLNLAHVAGPKPFSPLTISAKPVAAPFGPTSPGSASAWVPTSPIGATTKPIPTAPTAGSRPAPRRGRGILNPSVAPGGRIPVCASCGTPIRGPFVTALGKTWCHNHFHCVNSQCRRPLQDIGFVEEQGQLYCEHCYETYLAPVCSKCNARIKGDCLNAIGKQWHPECFVCSYCRTAFGNNHFYLEDGLPYCEKDWNELFTTKCVGCGFPIEAGDRWVEALNSNYHSQCFKCTICHKNLEGQSFYAKGGRPFCKNHAR